MLVTDRKCYHSNKELKIKYIWFIFRNKGSKKKVDLSVKEKNVTNLKLLVQCNFFQKKDEIKMLSEK
jgi:hypothetical protein